MIRTKLQALLHNTQHASIFALCLAVVGVFLGFVGFLASVLVGVVTLKRGPKAGLVVLLWALLPILSSMIVGYFSLADIYLLEMVLMWLLAWQAHRGASWLQLIRLQWLLAVMFIIVLHLVIGNLSTHWQQWVMGNLKSSLISNQLSDFLNTVDLNTVVTQLAPFATGLTISSVIFDVMLTLILAKVAVEWLYPHSTVHLDFLTLRIPMVYTLAWMALMTVGFLAHVAWVIDSLPVAVLAFVFTGFSVFNAYIRLNPRRWGLIIPAYIILLLFLPVACLIAILLGLTDSFIDFRRSWQNLPKKSNVTLSK